jgi:hypothetical protein
VRRAACAARNPCSVLRTSQPMQRGRTRRMPRAQTRGVAFPRASRRAAPRVLPLQDPCCMLRCTPRADLRRGRLGRRQRTLLHVFKRWQIWSMRRSAQQPLKARAPGCQPNATRRSRRRRAWPTMARTRARNVHQTLAQRGSASARRKREDNAPRAPAAHATAAARKRNGRASKRTKERGAALQEIVRELRLESAENKRAAARRD